MNKKKIYSFKYYAHALKTHTHSLLREEVGGDFCGNFERNYWVFSRALKAETTGSL